MGQACGGTKSEKDKECTKVHPKPTPEGNLKPQLTQIQKDATLISPNEFADKMGFMQSNEIQSDVMDLDYVIHSKKNSQPFVIHLLGGPFSGIEEVLQQLIKKYGFVHLDSIKVIQDHLKEREVLKTSLSENTRPDFSNELFEINGSFLDVSPQCIGYLMKQAMEDNGWGDSKFIITNFPVNIGHGQYWKGTMDIREIVDFAGFVYLKLPKERMKEIAAEELENDGKEGNCEILEIQSKKIDLFFEKDFGGFTDDLLRNCGVYEIMVATMNVFEIFDKCSEWIDL